MTALPEIDISIIIPAKDEEVRLPPFLLDVISFCQASAYAFEIIVVDDGSQDRTSATVEKFQAKFHRLHLISLQENRGKGYAVKQGVLHAKGRMVLFMDADGSTPPAMIEEYCPLLEQGYDVVIGSRVVTDEQHRILAKSYRKFVGQVFNFIVHRVLMSDILDTQCGFKMFRAETLRPLFGRLNISGFGFDLELLYLARLLGYRIKEVPVDWRHVDASKTNLLTDSLRMLMNIFQIRIWHSQTGVRAAPHMSPAEIELMHQNESRHWWFQSKSKLVNEKIGSVNKEVATILDAGCGTGLNLQSLAAVGECYGCDVMLPALRYCARYSQGRLALCHLEKLSYRTQSFDLITSLDVIEHVPEPGKVIAEFKRVLAADGRMIVTVPAFKFLWSPHDEALSHYRRYHRAELRQLLQDAGLHVEELGYHFCLAFLIAAPARIIKRLFIRSAKPQSDTTRLPPRWLNRLLISWQDYERRLARHIPLPFGTTLFAVVSKQESPGNMTYRFQVDSPAEEALISVSEQQPIPK